MGVEDEERAVQRLRPSTTRRRHSQASR
jgi:hypothetical protein